MGVPGVAIAAQIGPHQAKAGDMPSVPIVRDGFRIGFHNAAVNKVPSVDSKACGAGRQINRLQFLPRQALVNKGAWLTCIPWRFARLAAANAPSNSVAALTAKSRAETARALAAAGYALNASASVGSSGLSMTATCDAPGTASLSSSVRW